MEHGWICTCVHAEEVQYTCISLTCPLLHEAVDVLVVGPVLWEVAYIKCMCINGVCGTGGCVRVSTGPHVYLAALPTLSIDLQTYKTAPVTSAAAAHQAATDAAKAERGADPARPSEAVAGDKSLHTGECMGLRPLFRERRSWGMACVL